MIALLADTLYDGTFYDLCLLWHRYFDVCDFVTDVADEIRFCSVCKLVVAFVVVFGFYDEVLLLKELHTAVDRRFVRV